MATHYVVRQQKPEHKPSRTAFRHHVAWGIVCLILIGVLGGMWVRAQSLETQNATLRSQIAQQKLPPTTCKVTDSWKPNSAREFSLATESGDRKYIVHVPHDFQGDRYYPLVFFYPGKGADAVVAERAVGLDNLPAIMVYPFPTEGKDGATAWLSAPYASGADDVKFTASILDKVQDTMCVDRTRVYAAGFSNGGGFASLLSCKLPGRFAAYAVVSGAMYYPDGDCKPPRPSPLISIHGDNDQIVPYGGVVWRNLPPVNDWSAMRASIEKCRSLITTYPNTSSVVTTWGDCRGKAEVQNIRIVNGTHGWGDVSNDTLWRFLSRFTL